MALSEIVSREIFSYWILNNNTVYLPYTYHILSLFEIRVVYTKWMFSVVRLARLVYVPYGLPYIIIINRHNRRIT